ncbi:metalloregulator ArsR/SmtB family transcription factor [Temperatibacter marinus]|uniref:Metalloregulator ArsR/SmtB family transcription factor n=1 Tax=Temperatibacter marinus TaxID=1456591 RepID=A0AA52EGT4_9PROT|nr:metalloregulator ArsR/SmtB family transcription factor [Temperatibacter marinus]WND02069.1 metalloregulator ArsR/SmtB family transcription factor [Temperatibacter marinus]
MFNGKSNQAMVNTMELLLSALRAAAEVTRLRILGLLGHGELTVSELVSILDQSQPRVSRHLRLMVEAGLLARFREGTWVFYRLADHGLQRQLINDLLPHIESDSGDLARDLERLKLLRAERATLAAEYFQENAEQWNEVRSLYVPELEVEKALIELAGEQRNGNLLDVGTGTGRILEVFSESISAGVGVDLSRDMLSVARNELDAKSIENCEVRLGDMYNLPVERGSKDLVIFHQVLHFADDPLMAIKEAEKSLRAGGALLIADFAPHQHEFLRDEHAHRRLGFSDEEVTSWAHGSALSYAENLTFKGDKLDVKVWRLEKGRES